MHFYAILEPQNPALLHPCCRVHHIYTDVVFENLGLTKKAILIFEILVEISFCFKVYVQWDTHN